MLNRSKYICYNIVGDVMNYLILKKSENDIKFRIYEKTRHGKIKRNVSYEELNRFINSINRNPDSISMFNINKNNLSFTVNDTSITLVNYSDFSNDKRFSSIFRKVRNKNFKLVSKTILTGTLVATSLLGLIKGIDFAKKIDVQAYGGMDYSTTFEDNSYVEENTLSENVEITPNTEYAGTKYVDDEPVIEKTTKEKETENENIKSELGNLDSANIEKAAKTRELYYDIIEKYAKTYGLDPDVICAIAIQERGVHSDTVDPGGAIGLMQIQVEVWDNKDINAYNYDTNTNEKVHITLNNLRDVSFNIKVGCMIFQNYLNEMNGNLTAAIQCYNMGPGSVNSMINKYCKDNNITRSELLNSNDNGWLNYRNSSYPGDPNYAEHVSRYIPEEKQTIKM